MPTVTLSNEQVVELVNQLPPAGKQAVLNALSAERAAWWDAALEDGERQMRRLAAERGLDWDRMDEQAREDFINDLMHEDRHVGRV